jgi:hypothetical protein
MKLWLASLVAAALTAAGIAVAAEAPTTPIVLTAKNGNVTFNHKAHATLKCDDCHAKGVPQKQEPLGKDKAHGVCIECHKAQAKGPTKCAECHKKA